MERAFKVIGLALVYVLAFFIVELFGIVHPYAWTYSAVIASVTASWPYFKLCQRYPIPGVAMLCAILMLLFNFIIGQGHEFLMLGCFGFGLIAEGLRKLLGNYRGRWGVITSYMVMSLIPFSKTCVLWIDFDTASSMFGKYVIGFTDIYYATLGRMLSYPILAAMIVITLVLAFIAMWILTRNWRPSDWFNRSYE